MKEECTVCGHKGDNVETVIDPYVKEIYDEEVYITACQACLQERVDDV